VGDIGKAVIRDREVLARDGFVTVVVRRDRDGRLADKPEIITRGFVYMKDSEPLLQAMSQAVADALKHATDATDENAIRERAAEALSKIIYSETKRRPMIVAIVA